jgi:hypothetical protein
MIKIYGNGFNATERKNFIPVIYSNILSSVDTLSEMSTEYGPPETVEGKEAKQYIDDTLRGYVFLTVCS